MNKTILTITGSDGTGGSGVQADMRCISQLGGVAASAVTSITVQNTLGIQEFYDLPASVVRQQVEAIINEWIIGDHAERNRQMMVSRLLDGHTIEQVAEEAGLSYRYAAGVIRRCEAKIFKHFPG